MKQLKKNLFAWMLGILAFFASTQEVKAQDNTGTEFWFSLFTERYTNDLGGVYVVGYYDATVTIDYVARDPLNDLAGDPQCTQYTFNLIGGVPQYVAIPYDLTVLCYRYTDSLETPEVAQKNGIKLTSTAPVAVYYQHFGSASSEMTPILPITEMGTDYLISAYREITNVTNNFQARSTVVATQNNTTVTFTLPNNTWTSKGQDINVIGNSINAGISHYPGTTWSVTLDEGESYTILCWDNDLSDSSGTQAQRDARLNFVPTGSTVTVNNNQGLNGVRIVADKTISVMGGTDCTWIGNDEYPGCGACDLTATHFRPTNKWKQKYITTQTLVRPNQTSLAVGLAATPNIEPFPANYNQLSVSDYLLITAKDNGTAVTISGAASYSKTLNAGQWFIYESPGNSNPTTPPPLTSPGATHHVITSNKPIQVVQMMKGWQCDNNNPADPTQMLVMEEPLWKKDYIVTNPTQYANNFFVFIIKEPGAGNVARSTLNLNVAGANIPIAAGNSPTNDGTGGWTQIGTTGYYFQRVNIGVGGAIKAKSVPNGAGNSFPFAFYASGSTNASSYGYMGGAVCNLIAEAKADPTPSCLGNPVTLSLDTTFNGGTVNGNLSYNYTWTVFQGGNQVGTNSGMLSPDVDYDFTGATPGQYMAVLNVTDNAGCSDLDTIYFNVIAPPVVNDLADVVNCGPYQLPAITGTNLSGGQKYYTGPGATGSFYSAGQTVSTPGVYYIFDSTAVDCSSEQDFTLTINSSPSVDPASIVRTCDGTNTQYTVEFTVTGGTGGPYTVTEVAPGGTGGSFAGNVWTSNPIPSGTAYNFQVTDANNCPPAIVSGVKNCDCTSEAGTMSSTLISMCGPDPIMAPTGSVNPVLDANDTVSYVLHTSSGGTLGTILDSNTVPTFAFNAGTMAYGTTYYISQIVGNNGGFGLVSLIDPCLSVAPGTPVVWYTPTSVAISAISPICFGTDAEVTFDLTGNGPFTVVYTNGESGQNETLNNASSQEIVVFPIDSTTTYTLVSATSNANGCAAVIDPSNDYVTIVVNDVPTYTNLVENCNGTNTAYTVSFDVVDGSAPYTITVNAPAGLTGTFTGNTWTSDPIPSSTPYDFTISDGNMCDSTQVTGMNTCVCTSSAGGMDLTQRVICGDGNITTTTNPGQPAYFDSNDTINYVLHTAPDNTMGTLLAQSQNPTFAFIPGTMTYGTVYYISAIVGNSDGNGNVDLSDICLSIAYGTPVIWNEIPQAVINSNAPVCAGNQLTLLGSNATNMTGVNYAWSGPNGFTSGQQNPVISNPSTLDSGVYTLLVSKTGCSSSTTMNIVVNSNAVADFTSTLESEVTVPHIYQFNNQSTNSNGYQWYFADEDSSTQVNPVHEFEETEGSVPVTLIALNANGCHDTITYMVAVQVDYSRDEALVFVPNSFTPDNNEYNQLFAPKFNESLDLQYYKMEIFNRWGELVFSTEDPYTGWDGTYNKEAVQAGVFTWKISFRDKYSHDRYKYQGTVLLLK